MVKCCRFLCGKGRELFSSCVVSYYSMRSIFFHLPFSPMHSFLLVSGRSSGGYFPWERKMLQANLI